MPLRIPFEAWQLTERRQNRRREITDQKASGYAFEAYPCDVTDFESSKACVAKIASDVGPVDILVNNAAQDASGSLFSLDIAGGDFILVGSEGRQNFSLLALERIAAIEKHLGINKRKIAA